MTGTVDLNSMARQIELILTEMRGMRDEMNSMRDEMRALSTMMLRMDGLVQAMTQELGAISGLLAEQSPAP
jgi:hypothetical protein